MGSSLSDILMEEYRQITKNKFNDRELTHLHDLFHGAVGHKKDMGVDEFKNYIEGLQVFKRIDPGERYEQLFRAFDFDGDGVISMKEFLQYHLAMSCDDLEPPELLRRSLFAMFDADRDGFISYQDMATVVANSRRWMGSGDDESKDQKLIVEGQIRSIIEFADRDQDGKISQQDLESSSQLPFSDDPELKSKLTVLHVMRDLGVTACYR